MTELVISQEMLKDLIKKYFPMATETQLKTLIEELLGEIPEMIHMR